MAETGAGDTLQQTLPGHCYLDAAFFERERRRIFTQDWFAVARSADFERVGDYRVVRLCGESILLVRATEKSIRAFYNVCRHRGSQLVPVADNEHLTGHFNSAIRCPYHSWSYALDGELKRTPHLEVDRRDLGLHGIELDVWGGFVFLRLARDTAGAGLIETIGEIDRRVERYRLADLRVGHTLSYSVAANWKVLLENYNECYHCAGVHPELCAVVPRFRRNGGSGLDWDRGIPHREGANTFTFSGTTTRKPFPDLDNDERTRHKGELLYPNLLLSLAMDHVAAFTLWPRSAGQTDIVCDFLFHPDEIASPEFNPSDAVEFWDLTNRQDWAICESVQRGMTSAVFNHGYYAPMEDLSLDIRDYVRQRIPDADVAKTE